MQTKKHFLTFLVIGCLLLVVSYVFIFQTVFATVPLQSHPAEQIAPGTFNEGDFFFPSTSKLGIGTTTTPVYKLDVQGGQINSSGGLCIAGTCKTAWDTVTNYWTALENNIYNNNSGNVGIGTTAPNAKLDINGGYIYLDDKYGVFLDSGLTYGWKPYNSTNNSMEFYTNSGTPSVIINMLGNVGIGQTSPTSGHLEVYGSGNQIWSTSIGTSGANRGILARAIGSGATTNTGGEFSSDGASTNYGIRISGPTNNINNFAIYSDSTAQSYFAGNVGIGTTNPTTGKLVVSGGNLDMTTNKIINLATPTASSDAATKSYVDGRGPTSWTCTSREGPLMDWYMDAACCMDDERLINGSCLNYDEGTRTLDDEYYVDNCWQCEWSASGNGKVRITCCK